MIHDALFTLFNTIRHTISFELKRTSLDLAPMHFKTLKVIHMTDSCTGQKLADYLGRDKAQINRLIKYLAEAHLIEKKQCKQDKRSQLISLTAAGNKALAVFTDIEKRVFDAMLEGVNEGEKALFKKLVLRFTDNLNDRRPPC